MYTHLSSKHYVIVVINTLESHYDFVIDLQTLPNTNFHVSLYLSRGMSSHYLNMLWFVIFTVNHVLAENNKHFAFNHFVPSQLSE